MPIIHGVDFEQRELEFLAKQKNVDIDSIMQELLAQQPQSVPILKRTVQQLLSTLTLDAEQPQLTATSDEGNSAAYTLPVDGERVAEQAYTPPMNGGQEEWQTYIPPALEPVSHRPRPVDNSGNSKLKEYIQKAQDALFTVLAKAKTVANSLGDRWLGGKNRSPIHTQPFSINPLKESVINPIRNVIVCLAGYVWLKGVVESSSTGIANVLDDSNAFSVWASLSAIQIAGMALFLEFMSDLGAVIKKVKNGEIALAGQKLTRDMVQNTLYFFAIYEFNKPWQILMITLGNIFLIEKFFEEKLFKDSFATHARTWAVRVELYLLMIISLFLSTNKTLSDMSLANASKFTPQDLIEISAAKVKENDFDLDPEQITKIHDHPMKLATGEYLYIVETAEKQTVVNNTGEKVFRVITKYPITGPDDFALMSLRYYKLKEYMPPANASTILKTVGDIDAYKTTLIVKANWNTGKKK